MDELTLEQRFALQRARYEMSRMSRPALERTALRLLKTRMEQKNGVQFTLLNAGIVFNFKEQSNGMPEVISEETFMELLERDYEDDSLPTDIMDVGYEDDDLEGDDLILG